MASETTAFFWQVLPIVLLIGVPSAIVLGRLGFNRWWAVPFSLLFFVSMWVLAFVRWPADRR